VEYILTGKPEVKKIHLEHLGADGSIILKIDLKK
jgi:hypothetical protein